MYGVASIAVAPERGRPGARTPSAPAARRAPPGDGVRGSEFSLQGFPENRLVQRLFAHQRLQLSMLTLELLEPLRLRDPHTAVRQR